ncbi:unnamed protein product [Durusdinium trenchii]|uniref:Aspartyl/asparaginy/proline hydroxylase domain-containing protein n=1 Tax=Durusdinium trenchii TaxID=1381693 RepID=A0ABP0QYS4_9DINO
MAPSSVIRYADGDEEEWPIQADLLRAASARPRPSLQRPSYFFEGLRAQAFWPRESFPKVVALLEACASELSEEVQSLLEDALSSESGEEPPRTKRRRGIEGAEGRPDDRLERNKNICSRTEVTPRSSPWQPQGEGLHEGVWLKLELWARGGPLASGKAAPKTRAAVAACMSTGEAMAVPPGRAALSYMMCGAHVKPHCGPTNHRLRLHLPLLLPSPQMTGLTVAGEARAWDLHRCLIFDDSFEHEVQLPPLSREDALSDARVVLLLDLWHPDAGGHWQTKHPDSATKEEAAKASCGSKLHKLCQKERNAPESMRTRCEV